MRRGKALPGIEDKGDIHLFLVLHSNICYPAIMPRTARASVGGMCYHVMNRGNGRARVFTCKAAYQGFVDLMQETCEHEPMAVLAYCLMPNHFHLALLPEQDGGLSRWMQRLLTAQVRRHHRGQLGSGHIWQGRFKAFPIQDDGHLLRVLRYVERNPLRAGLVDCASAWPWSSTHLRAAGDPAGLLSHPPVPLPKDWIAWVNQPQTEVELDAIRKSIKRGAPWGQEEWVQQTAQRLGLESALRPRGRPRKKEAEEG